MMKTLINNTMLGKDSMFLIPLMLCNIFLKISKNYSKGLSGVYY